MDGKFWVPFVFVVMLLFWIGASFMEARAFERVTGTRVSTFEAMFINLRVEGCELRDDR